MESTQHDVSFSSKVEQDSSSWPETMDVSSNAGQIALGADTARHTTAAAAATTSVMEQAPQQKQQRRNVRVLKGAMISPIGTQQPIALNNKKGTMIARPASKTVAGAKNPVPAKAPSTTLTNLQSPTKATTTVKTGITKNSNSNPIPPAATPKDSSSSFVDLGGSKETKAKSPPSQAPKKAKESSTKKDESSTTVDETSGNDGIPNGIGLETEQAVGTAVQKTTSKPRSPPNKKKPGSLPAARPSVPHSTESPPAEAPASSPQSYLFPPEGAANSTKSKTPAATNNNSNTRSSCQSRHKNSLLAQLSCQASSTWSSHPLTSSLSLILLLILLVLWKRCCCGSRSGAGGIHGLRPRRDHRGEYRQLTTEFGDNPFNDDVSDYMEDGEEFEDFDDEHGVDYYHQPPGKATTNRNHAPARGIELGRLDRRLTLEEANG